VRSEYSDPYVQYTLSRFEVIDYRIQLAPSGEGW
jgi:hypothetical protein